MKSKLRVTILYCDYLSEYTHPPKLREHVIVSYFGLFFIISVWFNKCECCTLGSIWRYKSFYLLEFILKLHVSQLCVGFSHYIVIQVNNIRNIKISRKFTLKVFGWCIFSLVIKTFLRFQPWILSPEDQVLTTD